ncbi:MAG: tyrosine-protein phosphatase [Acidimicrobiales bacterium]
MEVGAGGNATGRHIPLSGCFNFRDLGGYPTRDGGCLRWRRLFRADGLTKLDEADCAALSELGLVTVIDLRTTSEVDQRGRFPVETVEVEYHHLPLSESIPGTEDAPDWGTAEYVTARYTQLLGDGAQQIARAFGLLASESSLPAVFHCSAGKDRTGVLAAIVLGCLGVPDEVIIDDYSLSSIGTARLMQSLREEYPDAIEEVEKYANAILCVIPEAMKGLIEHVRVDHGGFDSLARELQVTAEVETLRNLVVEPG